jgi:cyclase
MRMRLKLVWLALATALCGIFPARAITGDRPEFRKLADGVYAYIGKLNDANAMAIVTSQGVIVVDTGNNNPDARALLTDIQSVTNQPVRYVVITQNHGDHIGGTPLFSPPATVILHERVAAQWAAMQSYQINSWRKRFPERAEALRNVNPIDTVVTFRDHMSLHLGGRDIELLYVDDMYNPGDVAVWLPKEGVLHASFAGYKDRHPDIRPDYSHGTTSGMLKQLDAYIALKPKIVIPAHGPLGDVRDLEAMVDYLVLARHKVRDMMERGQALPAIEKAFNMAEFKDWDRTEHLSWTADTIYRELQGEGPLISRTTQLRVRGVIAKAVQDGRFVTVRADDGQDRQLRISADTDVEGIADRTELRAGMKISALYQIAEGISPALGYDALELDVTR